MHITLGVETKGGMAINRGVCDYDGDDFGVDRVRRPERASRGQFFQGLVLEIVDGHGEGGVHWKLSS